MHTPSFDGRANTHTDREGAPTSIHVLSVCPPVKFLGEMFGEMNGAKELKGVLANKNLCRLAQPGWMGDVGSNEV